MRMDAHLSVIPAKVRDHGLARHTAMRLDAGRAFVLATAEGWPRLWARLTGAATSGFDAGLAGAGGLRGRERLRAAMGGARAGLEACARGLIEQAPHDVALLGALMDGGELHVHRVGRPRAYLHRAGKTERITPRDDPANGLLGGPWWEGSLLLDPSDLVLLGSATAFSSQAVGKVASVLAQDPNAPPSVLATLLTEPADRAGAGAAAVALRAR
jgi:hypothetical protein